MRVISCFIVSAAILCSSAAALAQCESAAMLFLKHPNKRTYIGLVNVAGGHVREDCKSALLKPNVNDSLLRIVETGNPWAIKVLVDGLHSLDGGDLEDAHRALGVSAEKNPKTILRLYAEKRISSVGLSSSMQMLPESLVDNTQGRIARLVQRSKIISAIKEPDLREARDIALEALKDRIVDERAIEK